MFTHRVNIPNKLNTEGELQMPEYFDIAMEFLSDKDRNTFNERDKKAKKALDELKPKMKRFKKLCQEIDDYIKKHPGCDKQDDAHPEIWDNCERKVSEAKSILDEFLMIEGQYSNILTKSSGRTGWLTTGWLLSFAITVMSCILLPTFGQKIIGLVGGGSLTAILGKIRSASSKDDEKKMAEKFKEWAEENPKNVDSIMKKADAMIEKTWSEFCSKYHSWIVSV